MRVLYIGHYMPGCTTRMRGAYLQDLLKPAAFFVVNTDIPIYSTPRLFRSFGWRYYRGPLVANVNTYIRSELKDQPDFDIVWIDKGVFIEPGLLADLKKSNTLLVHFTPDTAFRGNRSKLFNRALPLYDYCITTKSFELDDYKKAGAHKILYCTQGYDPQLHKPYHDFAEKKGVVFIGQQEAWREAAIAKLVEKKIGVTVAGAGWTSFANKYKNNPHLQYKGCGLFHEEYAKTISAGLIGLGLLSRKFPEKHTTRTFEIPACGTALAAEDNEETRQFYTDEEVLYFTGLAEMTEKIEYYLHHKALLNTLIENGHNKVVRGGFDYPGILKKLLDKMGVRI
ncbi:MAG: glycosyltransferase [Bacteroidota bacterium]